MRAAFHLGVTQLDCIGPTAQGGGHAGTPARTGLGARRVVIAGGKSSTGQFTCIQQRTVRSKTSVRLRQAGTQRSAVRLTAEPSTPATTDRPFTSPSSPSNNMMC